jgi:hypothetical protein
MRSRKRDPEAAKRSAAETRKRIAEAIKPYNKKARTCPLCGRGG